MSSGSNGRKRSREDIIEVEDLDEKEDEEGKKGCCRCAKCSKCGSNEEMLRRMEQRDQALTRIIQEIAKEVSDFKNVGMSLISKLTSSMEEQQDGLGHLDKRTVNLGKLVKNMKTRSGEGEEAPSSVQSTTLLSISKQLALIQNTVVKEFAQIRK